jgi:hypothetical protein
MGSIVPRIAALACSLSFARSVQADEDRVVPCRPTVTCTADLAPPGTLELELGDQLRRASGTYQDTTPFLAKLPLSSALELQLGSNGFTYSSDARYFDNMVMGAKVHFVDQSSRRPSLAVTASVSVPTASQRGYERIYAAGVVAQASKDLGHLHGDLDAGLTAEQLGGPRAYQPWAACAATYAVTPRLSVALEPHYFADASPFASRDAGAIAAVELTARDWLVVDAALDVTLWDQRAVMAIVGVSIAPVRLWVPR